MVHRVAVIGAGAVGLSAALSIQKNVPNVKVTLIADKFNESTTSWGAGGFFRLDLGNFQPDDLDRVRQWGRDSWNFYTSLASSKRAPECGMTFCPTNLFFNTQKDAEYSLLADLAYDFQKLNESQVKKMNMPVPFKLSYSFTTVLTHTETYLRWLMQQFLDCGGSVVCHKVTSLSELRDNYDIVVNCCGLNAIDLCQDKSMFPVLGHLVKIKAPWFRKAFFCEECYIFPHNDYVLIGGIRQKDNWNLASNPENRQTILTRAYRLFPHLKRAPIVGEWVGLRPVRKSIRLEVEHVKCGGKKPLPVVHNYGHGGHGITLSWGCAVNATKLVQDLVNATHARL